MRSNITFFMKPPIVECIFHGIIHWKTVSNEVNTLFRHFMTNTSKTPHNSSYQNKPESLKLENLTRKNLLFQCKCVQTNRNMR